MRTLTMPWKRKACPSSIDNASVKVGRPSKDGCTSCDQAQCRMQSERKRKLSQTTVYREINKGNIGMSPPKKGPQTKIPDLLLDITATQHTEVCQVGTDGELQGQEIKRVLGAAVSGTKYDNKFTIESAWRKL